ncbi:MAG: cytidine deaminase [Pseudomonadota bacterium]
MDHLIQKAKEARDKAYAPYSEFRVGAALESSDGKIFTGCNVESASYGATCCAERTALVKAISEGVREFTRIAIFAGTKEPCPPCGICRQMLYEFAPELEVIMAGTEGKATSSKLSELMPNPFHSERLGCKRTGK